MSFCPYRFPEWLAYKGGGNEWVGMSGWGRKEAMSEWECRGGEERREGKGDLASGVLIIRQINE